MWSQRLRRPSISLGLLARLMALLGQMQAFLVEPGAAELRSRAWAQRKVARSVNVSG